MKVLTTTLLTLTSASFLLLSSCGSDKGRLAPNAGTIVESNPKAAALLSKAQGEQKAGKTKRANKTYVQLFEKYPYSAESGIARYQHAKIEQQLGELILSFNSYQAFLIRHPNDPNYDDALKQQATVAHAAAEGSLTNNFLGLETKIDAVKIDSMLKSVISHAPRSPSASKAQFAIGQLWQNRGSSKKAITGYKETVSDYPNSKEASEAQYRIGVILMEQAARGNQDVSNLQAASKAFKDYLTGYPNGKRKAKVKTQLKNIEQKDINNSLRVAEFYEKKKQYESAKYYYKEVMNKTKSGPIFNRAKSRLEALKGA